MAPKDDRGAGAVADAAKAERAVLAAVILARYFRPDVTSSDFEEAHPIRVPAHGNAERVRIDVGGRFYVGGVGRTPASAWRSLARRLAGAVLGVWGPFLIAGAPATQQDGLRAGAALEEARRAYGPGLFPCATCGGFGWDDTGRTDDGLCAGCDGGEQ